MNNKQLYEKIMRNISKQLKKALNEDMYQEDDSDILDHDTIDSVIFPRENGYYVPKDKETLMEIIDYLLSRGERDLNCIDVSYINDFSYVFNENTYLTSHNGKFEEGKTVWLDMDEWDVSNATTFEGMFGGCTYFNADLSDWDVSNCEIFSGMFYNCESFDCDLSGWDVGNGEAFKAMFYNCGNQMTDLSNWDIDSDANVVGMIALSGCSCDGLGAEAIMF